MWRVYTHSGLSVIGFNDSLPTVIICTAIMHELMFTAHLDLSTICEELAIVKYKWREIGLKLHIPYHKLKEFQEEKDRFVEVINYWLNGNVEDVPVTWRSIVTVLESSSVDERGLAKTIMDKYCQSEPNNSKGSYHSKNCCKHMQYILYKL